MQNLPFKRELIKRVDLLKTYWGYDSSTDLKCFIIRYQSDFSFSQKLVDEFKGLHIHIIEGNDFKEIIILLTEKKLEETFDILCNDIIDFLEIAVNELIAIKGVNTKLESWKMLFARLANSVLTIERQKGLFGELTFLQTLLENGLNSEIALLAWTGPEMERRDFLLDRIGVEVKMTSANHPVLRISNETQLEINSLKHLFLILYSMEVRKGTQTTLVDLVNAIRDRLESLSEKELFRLKLSQYGYFEKDEGYYESREFIVREIYSYKVEDNFPRLIPQNIPAGVFDSSYRVELSSCEHYKTPFDTIVFKFMNNE